MVSLQMVDLPLTGAQAELEGEFGKKAGNAPRFKVVGKVWLRPGSHCARDLLSLPVSAEQ